MNLATFSRFCCAKLVLILLIASNFTLLELSRGEVALAQALAEAVAPTETSLLEPWELPPSRRDEWLQAKDQLLRRQQIAEELGEEAARIYARKQGWEPVFDGTSRRIPQGPDQVWRNPRTGEVIVIEAKGGHGKIGGGYGHPQGSSEWAVKSAKEVLRRPNASLAERQAAEAVLEAAAEGKLRVQTVRLQHVLGEPKALKLVGDERVTVKAMQEAKEFLQSPSRAAGASNRAAQRASGVGADARKAESLPAKGNGQPHIGEKGQATNAGAEGGSTTARKVGEAVRTGSQALNRANKAKDGARAAIRTAPKDPWMSPCPSPPGPPRACSTRILVGAAAVVGAAVDVGCRAAEAWKVEKAYQRGQISDDERWEAHAGNALGMVGGWGGGAVGGSCGAYAGAAIGTLICPGIGTAVGGVIGAIVGGVGGYTLGDSLGRAAASAVF